MGQHIRLPWYLKALEHYLSDVVENAACNADLLSVLFYPFFWRHEFV